MVSTVSKLANPWKCDAPGCGVLRAKDTNHWLILRLQDRNQAYPLMDVNPEVVIASWADGLADCVDVKHVCGIDCGLKVAAQLIDERLFGNRGKEVEP